MKPIECPELRAFGAPFENYVRSSTQKPKSIIANPLGIKQQSTVPESIILQYPSSSIHRRYYRSSAGSRFRLSTSRADAWWSMCGRAACRLRVSGW